MRQKGHSEAGVKMNENKRELIYTETQTHIFTLIISDPYIQTHIKPA